MPIVISIFAIFLPIFIVVFWAIPNLIIINKIQKMKNEQYKKEKREQLFRDIVLFLRK